MLGAQHLRGKLQLIIPSSSHIWYMVFPGRIHIPGPPAASRDHCMWPSYSCEEEQFLEKLLRDKVRDIKGCADLRGRITRRELMQERSKYNLWFV